MKWAGHVARMGDWGRCIQECCGETGGKESLGRPRRTWENQIKMDLREMGWGGGGGVKADLIWFRVGSGGGLL